MRIGICSYSFHRLLASGKQDIFKFIDDCKELGCTQLDPWNAHLAEVRAGDDHLSPGAPPVEAGKLSPAERAYVERVRDAGRKSGLGIELLIENHWGSSAIPDNVARILHALPGLGLLYDTHNWKAELRAEARSSFAKYARAVHVKTFSWDAEGNEVEADIPTAVGHLRGVGYAGTWGIESVPRDGDEYAGVKKTIALLRRLAA
jgi:hypothetical protein